MEAKWSETGEETERQREKEAKRDCLGDARCAFKLGAKLWLVDFLPSHLFAVQGMFGVVSLTVVVVVLGRQAGGQEEEERERERER